MNEKGMFKSQAIFQTIIRDAVSDLWNGHITLLIFVDELATAIPLYYNEAWNFGARECGVRPEERTGEEERRLQQMIQSDLQWVYRFGTVCLEAGFQTRQTTDAPKKYSLKAMLNRGKLWINRFLEVKNAARAMACANAKYMWVIGSTHEHCGDCQKYAGRVYRGAMWASHGALPQGQALECGGFRCRCRLVKTDQPFTPGPVPWPSGRRGGISPLPASLGGPIVPLEF
jgi:hypothetical protein